MDRQTTTWQRMSMFFPWIHSIQYHFPSIVYTRYAATNSSRSWVTSIEIECETTTTTEITLNKLPQPSQTVKWKQLITRVNFIRFVFPCRNRKTPPAPLPSGPCSAEYGENPFRRTSLVPSVNNYSIESNLSSNYAGARKGLWQTLASRLTCLPLPREWRQACCLGPLHLRQESSASELPNFHLLNSSSHPWNHRCCRQDRCIQKSMHSLTNSETVIGVFIYTCLNQRCIHLYTYYLVGAFIHANIHPIIDVFISAFINTYIHTYIQAAIGWGIIWCVHTYKRLVWDDHAYKYKNKLPTMLSAIRSI